MTKEEFIEGYCERSGITREQFDENFIAATCDCGEAICKGWRVESKDIHLTIASKAEPSYVNFRNNNIELLKIVAETDNIARIIFNKEVYPEYTANDFAREFIDIVEKLIINLEKRS